MNKALLCIEILGTHTRTATEEYLNEVCDTIFLFEKQIIVEGVDLKGFRRVYQGAIENVINVDIEIVHSFSCATSTSVVQILP